MAECKVRLDGFKWSRPGYVQVKGSAPVQAILARKAARAESAARSMSSGKYKTSHRQGKQDMYYSVVADDYEARLDQAKRKVLTKAVNSIGGS